MSTFARLLSVRDLSCVVTFISGNAILASLLVKDPKLWLQSIFLNFLAMITLLEMKATGGWYGRPCSSTSLLAASLV